ncbi:hypothetical protein [Halorientalis salina]|uniref:hypothetical protein n=1 Tax=Halorientalis salina TaxID=2932266 RepID=UPI0010AB5F3C|nr:hypothetical protein [Halorientalis salina]
MTEDSEDSDDPFEGFDAPDDVDPFEDLEGPTEPDEDTTEDRGESTHGSVPDGDDRTQPEGMAENPFGESDGGREGAGGPFGSGEPHEDPASGAATDDADPTDDPFASFSGAGGRTGTDEDPFGSFESAGVDEIDPDVVWEALSAAEEEGMPEFDEKVYYEVSKHSFCERCEYFSSPPECTCTYDGAAIVEFLDMETVRLLNCPVVAEQRELEESVGKIGSD